MNKNYSLEDVKCYLEQNNVNKDQIYIIKTANEDRLYVVKYRINKESIVVSIIMKNDKFCADISEEESGTFINENIEFNYDDINKLNDILNKHN